MMLLDSPTEHGWDSEGNVKWTNECFPDDISSLMATRENNHNESNEDFECIGDDYDEDDSDIDEE